MPHLPQDSVEKRRIGLEKILYVVYEHTIRQAEAMRNLSPHALHAVCGSTFRSLLQMICAVRTRVFKSIWTERIYPKARSPRAGLCPSRSLATCENRGAGKARGRGQMASARRFTRSCNLC